MILTGVVGWKCVAMETKDSMGGVASGEGMAVFIGLVRDDKDERVCRRVSE